MYVSYIHVTHAYNSVYHSINVNFTIGVEFTYNILIFEMVQARILEVRGRQMGPRKVDQGPLIYQVMNREW